MPAAPVIDLYRASHASRVAHLRALAAERERVMRADLAVLVEEFGACLREILHRYEPTGDGELVPALHADLCPELSAEVLFVWGNYGDAFEEARRDACREIARLMDRAARAEAALTQPEAEAEPVPEVAPEPEPVRPPARVLRLLRPAPDPAAWDLTGSITLPKL